MGIVRWGLIGTGDIVRNRVAAAIRDGQGSELVSISRRDPNLAEGIAEELGARKWFADWREQIVDEEIDAVYIATPVFLHAEQTIAVAKTGKHVLCEKPMALSVGECHSMIDACRSNNVKLGIAYYRRFYPAIVRIKKIIADGEIGSVSVAQINAFEYFDPEPDHPRHWFVEKGKSGGGPMIDFGCHRLEVLRNIFGNVTRVESLVSNVAFGREVEDTAAAIIQFETGTCASVTVTHATIEPQDTLHIFGTKGSIHIPILNSGEMTIKIGGVERLESLPPSTNFHEPLISDFAAAVMHDRDPEVTGEDGRDVQAMLEEIYKKGN